MSTRYISAPVEIDAWLYEGRHESAAILPILRAAPNLYDAHMEGERINTLSMDGVRCQINPGDYIIKRPNGVVTSLPAHVFKTKYTRLL